MRGQGSKLATGASLVFVLACGPVEEAAPPQTPSGPVIVVHQQPPQIVQPAPQAQPAPAPLPAADDLAPRPRLSRTITLGQGNDQPVFEGPSRVQGPVAQADPNSTTFRYSPYYNHAPAYYGPTYYRGGYVRSGYYRSFGAYHAPRPSSGPALTPPVGGDWPRAPIGGGASMAPSAPQVSAPMGAGAAVGGTGGGSFGSGGGILR
jgi:hypothetical protein